MNLPVWFIPAIAGLVILTNIIVQVLKQVTWKKISTNTLAMIVGIALTVAAGIAYLQIMTITITWWMILVLFVIGFAVAFAAMFGFDKLVEAIRQWEKVKEGAE